MKTGLYKLDDAKFIMDHYNEELTGKDMGDASKSIRITHIELDEVNKDEYRVICRGEGLTPIILPHINIETVLERYQLPQPTEILKERR
jgi:hypothetical protein